MSHQQFAYVNNDNLLTVRGLQSIAANSLGFTNTASVVVTCVLSGTATEVTGATWPIAMTLTNSEVGEWQTTLVDSLVLTADEYYEAQVTADNGTDMKGYWVIPLQAKNRTR